MSVSQIPHEILECTACFTAKNLRKHHVQIINQLFVLLFQRITLHEYYLPPFILKVIQFSVIIHILSLILIKGHSSHNQPMRGELISMFSLSEFILCLNYLDSFPHYTAMFQHSHSSRCVTQNSFCQTLAITTRIETLSRS